MDEGTEGRGGAGEVTNSGRDEREQRVSGGVRCQLLLSAPSSSLPLLQFLSFLQVEEPFPSLPLPLASVNCF